ncbi:MAG: hypothetical protein ACR65O_07160 [Methylomicrobium sp.]|jgi:hypothetical protein
MKIFDFFKKKLWLPAVFGAILAAGNVQTAYSGDVGSEGARGGGSSGTSGTMGEGGAVQQAPSFRQADKNGDHYVSKEELEGFPELLKRFDEVDAGKTGRLEEHEYGNLIMEKSREKGR